MVHAVLTELGHNRCLPKKAIKTIKIRTTESPDIKLQQLPPEGCLPLVYTRQPRLGTSSRIRNWKSKIETRVVARSRILSQLEALAGHSGARPRGATLDCCCNRKRFDRPIVVAGLSYLVLYVNHCDMVLAQYEEGKMQPILRTVLTASFLLAAQGQGDQTKPRVYVTDSSSWEISGGWGESGGSGGGALKGGARPQTAEIVKTFGERCPDVLANNKKELADYVVILDHEGGKGIAHKRNKIAVFNRSGDSIFSDSTRSLGNSVKDACSAIVSDFEYNPPKPATAPAEDVRLARPAGVAAPSQPAPGASTPPCWRSG